MSDPAVEAAQRAMGKCHSYPTPNRDLIAAAREALAPIRKMHDDWKASYGFLPTEALQILDDLAELIYATEELENE